MEFGRQTKGEMWQMAAFPFRLGHNKNNKSREDWVCPLLKRTGLAEVATSCCVLPHVRLRDAVELTV